MSQLNQKYISKVINLVLIFAIIIAILGLFVDLRNTLKYGGIDLRNRVVGARVLTKGLDPYHFKWRPGNDERLIDPFDLPSIPVSRVTVNPSVLLFHSLFANMPYFYQRILWFFLQWAFLIVPLYIFTINKLHLYRTKLILITVLTLFSSSLLWKLHIDVGQFYIVYVFLFSSGYYFFKSDIKQKNTLGGFFVGLAACFRFPIIIMVLPMILFKQTKMLVATLISFFFFLIASLLLAGSQVWQSYFAAMRTFGQLNIGSISVPKGSTKDIYPKIIEGMSNLHSFAGGIPNGDSSLQSVLKKNLSFQLESKYSLMLIAVALLLYCFAIYYTSQQKKSQNVPTLDLIFLTGTISILIADFLIPAPRYPYNDVQFIIPLIILLQNANFYNMRILSCICLMFIGLLTMNGMFSWVPAEIQVGQFLTLTSMILMSLMLVRGIPTSSHSSDSDSRLL